MNRLLAVDKPPTCAGEWVMRPDENEKIESDAEQARWEDAREIKAALKYEHKLKSMAVEIENLRRKLQIAEYVLNGVGLTFVDPS